MKTKIRHYPLVLVLLAPIMGMNLPAAELKLHYPFDENTGTPAASTVNADTNNVLNLSASGTTWGASMPGMGTALSITGTGGRAQAALASSWSAQTLTGSNTGSMSMTLWIKPTSLPTSGTGFLMGATQQSGSFHHQMNIRLNGATDPNNSVWGQAGGSNAASSGNAHAGASTGTAGDIDTGVWTHVAATFDAGTKTVITYINGAQVGTSTSSTWDHFWPETDLAASIVGSTGTTSAPGLYDDVRIYSGVLTPEEVQTIATPPVAPALKIISMTPDFVNHTVTVTWSSITGASYDLLVSPDLTEGSWEYLGPAYTGAPGDSTTVTAEDPAMATETKRFYRVHLYTP